MKDLVKILLMCTALVLLSLLLLGADVKYVDTVGIGSPIIQPQIVAAVPAQPYACVIAQRARVIYVDDTNDTDEAYLCFCGVDADDSTYIWLKIEDPNTDCF